jgi:hypothetical protein
MKIHYGAMVSDGSGAIGGVVASRNHYGPYFRHRTTPINRNTARQTAARNNLKSLSQLWSSTLTAAQRGEWAVYAAAVPYVNPLGASIYLTPMAMYVACNSPRLLAGIDRIDNGPAILLRGETDPTLAFTASAATQELSVTFDHDLPWAVEADSGLLIQVAQPANATREFIGGPWRYAGFVEGVPITKAVSPATITSPFIFQAAQKLVIRARVSRVDGRLSPFFRAECIGSA